MSAWKNKYINKNPFSRPAIKLNGVKKLVVHYTANNGGTAMNHYNYFNNLKDRYASAHIFVDKDEALCIIPLDEISYHCNDVQKYVNGKPYRGVKELSPNGNLLSIGVEMCLEKDGTLYNDTVTRTEDVFVELCKMYKLDPINDIVRHFDHTGKNCPAPWVKNEKLFIEFKKNVSVKLKGNVAKSEQKEQHVKTTTTKPSTQSKSSDTITIKGNKYYNINPKKVKLLTTCKLYNNVNLEKATGGEFNSGSMFTITGISKTNSGIPRLKTKSGYYLTANLKYVQKV